MKKWMFLCTAAALLFAACNNEKKRKMKKKMPKPLQKKWLRFLFLLPILLPLK